jgi:integrase/recombinase XerD
MQSKPYRFQLKYDGRPDSLHTLAVEFFESGRLKNLSPRTIEHFDFDLDRFISWAALRGISTPSQVTRAVLVAYQRALFYHRKKDGQPLAFSSQSRALVTLRGFFRWLSKNDHVDGNPAADLDLPKVENRLPKHVLSVAEVEAVLAVVDVDQPLGLRDRGILEVLYSTGMRRHELAGLKLTDLDDDRGVVTVRQGKGKKDRVIPIGDRACAWVKKWVDEERDQWVTEADEGFVFVSNDGSAMGLGWLSRMVGAYVDKAEIGKRGSCHLFRHTMATLLLEGGADIRFIQEILGHASAATTQIYTRVSIRQLKAVHTMAHPAHLDKRPAAVDDDAEPAPTSEDLFSALDAEAVDEAQLDGA